jgi:hypothetical protein
VVASDGRDVGEVDHIRYSKHADHPDFVVIKRRVFLWKRLGVVPFEAVESVDREREIVSLRIASGQIQRA